MKMAEFLNIDTKQVQWLDASLEHPNLVKVPEGAETAVVGRLGTITFYKGDFSYYWCGGWVISDLGANGRPAIWQRNPLQEKINETLSILNVNKAKLSILLGREKSYVKRLLAKNRNVTEKTKATVIDQLDQLIHKNDKKLKSEFKDCIVTGKPNVDLGVSISDHSILQFQLNSTKKLLDAANKNSLMWMKNYKDQRDISWFLFWLFAVTGCASLLLLWSVL